MHLLTDEHGLAAALSSELGDLRDAIRPCDVCRNLAEVDASGLARCSICRDPKRDTSVICVVGKVQDLIALERSRAINCRYFVLGRLLSPLDGIHASDLPTDQLAKLITDHQVREVIIATPPSVDGEATALHLVRELEPLGVSCSRIASGIPHGGDLEYADQVTLGRALLGRRPLTNNSQD